MINIENDQTEVEEPQQDPDVDERHGVVITGFLRISDPETGEVIVQGRA